MYFLMRPIVPIIFFLSPYVNKEQKNKIIKLFPTFLVIKLFSYKQVEPVVTEVYETQKILFNKF